VKEKSDYINSDYGDVMYMVYIWGFPCLDYSFDVLTSQIGNVGLYNWFYCCYFTYCLISCPYLFIACLVYLSHVTIFVTWLCIPMLSIPFSMHVFRFRITDIHVFTWSRIYCHSHLCYLSFPVPAWLDHVTWSCTRVPIMHAIWLYSLYSLGLLTTLDSHVQILESGPWQPCCTWSE